MSIRSPRSEFVRKALLALMPAVLLLAVAGSASASTRQETILQDDRLFGDPGRQFAALAEADSLGVDTIHSVVVWDTLAPSNDSRRKPSGFNGANPGDYEAEKWDRFDNLVREADRLGIDLLLSPSGPVPTWASQCRRPGTPKVCEPDPDEYEDFFAAVVKRYNGRTRDENQGGGTLPKVDRFSVWNEPNLKGWLQPTSTNVRQYRELWYAAERGLRKGRQPRAQLLLGEVAPLKSLRFYQQLFCIDRNGRPLTGRAATKAGCRSGRRIKQLKATGVAHHPYARGGSSPFGRSGRDDITLKDIEKLEDVLDDAARQRAIKRNLPIFVTEFGISTRPPANKFGVRLSQQPRELNRSEFAMYENRRIRSYTQFQLFDDTNIENFQTGLKLGDSGVEKPGYAAFRMPIYVVRDGRQARVWGGVRPGKGDRVDIQTQSGGNWSTVRTVTVDRYGYIDEDIPLPRGDVRLRWTAPDGVEFTSREAAVERE